MAGIPTIENYSMPSATELPENVATWRVDPRRATLLIHDMQKYFVRRFPEPLRTSLVDNIARLRRWCVELNVPVAYTAQPGGMTEEQRGLLRDFWGPGMRVDPADRDIVEPLTPHPADWRFVKWRYSAFHRSRLLDRMRAAGRDQLVICGVYAHVGIQATAVDALSHDVQAFLVADAVADFSARDHWRTLEYAASRCAVVATTDEVVEQLRLPAYPGAAALEAVEVRA